MVGEWFYFALSCFFLFANVVPWIFKGRWRKCMRICVGMNFKVSYIFIEDSNCVNKLVNLDVDNKLYFFWYFVMLRCLSLIFFFITNINFLCSVFRWWTFFLHEFGVVPRIFVTFSFFFYGMFHVMIDDWWILGCQPS